MLADIRDADLQTCINVLMRIREKAEKNDKVRRRLLLVYVGPDGHKRHRYSISTKKALGTPVEKFK